MEQSRVLSHTDEGTCSDFYRISLFAENRYSYTRRNKHISKRPMYGSSVSFKKLERGLIGHVVDSILLRSATEGYYKIKIVHRINSASIPAGIERPTTSYYDSNAKSRYVFLE